MAQFHALHKSSRRVSQMVSTGGGLFLLGFCIVETASVVSGWHLIELAGCAIQLLGAICLLMWSVAIFRLTTKAE
jgi:hypothetical protein